MNDELISRQAVIDSLRVAYWDDNIQSAKDDPCIIDAMTDWAIRQVKALPPAQPETCDGCKHKGKWENEVEYGYNSPCTVCKRRLSDNYERRSDK